MRHWYNHILGSACTLKRKKAKMICIYKLMNPNRFTSYFDVFLFQALHENTESNWTDAQNSVNEVFNFEMLKKFKVVLK